jgi:hypothetical protein
LKRVHQGFLMTEQQAIIIPQENDRCINPS